MGCRQGGAGWRVLSGLGVGSAVRCWVRVARVVGVAGLGFGGEWECEEEAGWGGMRGVFERCHVKLVHTVGWMLFPDKGPKLIEKSHLGH